ncbi:MAG: folate-binding protein YgfZ [Spongiibacteraceae bacterium]|nr:folate-binding protein YgfZ [Spongiibacteraceae bacterium]
MSNSLPTFLAAIGAELTQDLHCQFTNKTGEAQATHNIIVPLTHYGLLSIEGSDTSTFLQGQTTCDINAIDEQQSLPGAYCTPKGRMICNFRVARSTPQHYYLRMRRPLVISTKAVFSKYIVFSKAEQHDASDDYLLLGLYGERSRATLEKTFGSAPKTQNQSQINNGIITMQLDEEGLCYECWVPHAQCSQLWTQLSQELSPVDTVAWERLCIRRGLGEVTKQTVETFIPQMLNYQLTGEINFKKGCYTGQEIVARMHYRGKLKRHMYRLALDINAPAPGTELRTEDGSQSIGNIVNAINNSDSGCEALAVMTIDSTINNTLIIGSNPTPVKILSLPYAINTKDT